MIRQPPRSTLFPYTALFQPQSQLVQWTLAPPEPVHLMTRLRDKPRVTVAFPPCTDELLALIRTADIDEITVSFRDRKSTRLNSSHANISYAVFCLKKKITSL